MRKQVLVLVFLLITFNLFSQTFVEQTGIALTGVNFGSVAWGDYDNDGNLDILLTGSSSSGPISKIYRNNGDSTFTEQSGINLTGVSNSCATWGDYDKDGDLDILLTGESNSGPISKIYRNNGDNTFTEQTGIMLTGVFSSSVAWGDYDNDGDLDILLTGWSGSGLISKIYRNNDDNTFTEQTGIALTGVDNGSVAWGDYDNDGDLDILLTGLGFSRIYHNNGDNSFTSLTGIELPGVDHSSVAWGDYDNDGDLDILLTGSGYTSKIFRNNNDNSFTGQTLIVFPGVILGSIAWGDYDNDGDLDILWTGYSGSGPVSKIYRNNGDNTFTEQTGIELPEVSYSSIAWGDYDNDQDLDILLTGENSAGQKISKIYRNETATPNIKPATPSNLKAVTNNGVVTFTWDKPLDTETPQNGLSYNIYVYEEGQIKYENPPHAFKQSDSKNGRRLIAKPGAIQWSQSGYTIKDLPPGKTYYWAVQAVDAGLRGGSFSSEQSFTLPFYRPVTQANCIAFSNMQATQATATWANGGGAKRAVFIKAAATGMADPVDNTTYNINDITPGGWKCVYNGTSNLAALTGLVINTVYLLQVCEYNGAAANENYLKSATYQNPAALNTILGEQTSIELKGVRNSSAALGDYNNDGDFDILLTGSGSISKIYLNNGDNSFTEQTGIALTGVYYSSVAWGDYDNDGDLDILLTGATGGYERYNSISKIYRNNGDNSFTEQTDIILPGVCLGSVAWSDYDNDGDLDILLTGQNNSYQNISKIYRNNGDNSFIDQTGIVLTGVYQSSIAWGDYDNDGDPDILLTGYSRSDPISKIYRNNGDNTFTGQADIALTGVYKSSSAWGDYDNDGDLDILLTGESGDYQNYNPVSKIYRNNGDNSFTEQTGIILTGVCQSSIAWSDYDNDGDLDIFLTGSTAEYPYNPISKIYRNNGDNTFTWQTGITLAGVSNSSMACGDYDNDSDLDILLTGDSGSGWISKIYRNEILNPNIKPSDPAGLQSYWDNNCLLFKWNKSSDNTTPAKAISYNLRIGTSPGGNEVKSAESLHDGKLLLPNIPNLINDTCIVLKLPLNKYYWSVQAVDIGGLAGSFAPEEITPADSIQATNLQAVIKNTNSILIRWKNGNGKRRALFGRFSSPSERAKPVDGTIYHAEPYFGKGNRIGNTGWYCLYNGIADSVIIYGLGEGYSYDIQVIEYTEINGLPEYFRTIGNGNPGVFSSSLFSEQSGIVLEGTNLSSVAWGDYNNDGYLDILVTGNASSGPVSKVYSNNGDNSFTEQSSIYLTNVSTGSVAWGDYDNDGDLDILLTGIAASGYISKIYKNNGNNSFTEQTGIVLDGVGYGSVAWGDYDNDDYLDILLTGQNNSNQRISKIFRNNGNNSFTEQTSIALTGVALSSVAWGDYDNDGDLDIILTGDNGSQGISKVYRNNGDNSFTEQTSIALKGIASSSVAWGDYDNDGDLDILLSGSHFSRVYRNNGDNSFTEQTNISLTDVYMSSVAWGDYDNDVDLDILLTGSTGGDENYKPISKIYRNNSNNSFTWQTDIPLTGAFYSSAAWGDYDNDGDLDMLIFPKVYSNNTFMKAGNYSANKKPSAPEKLLAFHQPNGILLTWSPVKTDETTWESMTYNVKVISTQDGSYICPAQSDSLTGYRRITAMGNAELDTIFLIKNLVSGKYYWSVQAVDQGYIGGDWSAVDSFQVKNVQTFYTADTVCLGHSTHFTDQSVATDGIASWKWDFKDGLTSSVQNPTHFYAASGTYYVKLVITSTGGAKDSLAKNIIVKSHPVTGFTALEACQGTPVTITNTTDCTGLNMTSWKWDFGDGQVSDISQPAPHGYLIAGDYSVSLKAIASNGCADSIIKTVTLANYPTADITTNAPLNFCEGDSVTLSVTYNNRYSYKWMVAGTAITEGDSNIYVPKFSGSFSVEVANPAGNCITISSLVTVAVKPVPFKPAINSENYQAGKCPGETPVRLIVNQAISEYSYKWYRDGMPVNNATSSYYEGFLLQGDYTVEADLNGCKSLSDKLNIYFDDTPEKPYIFVQGPTLWYLACSNDSASKYRWYCNEKLIEGADKYYYVANRKMGDYQVSIANDKGCYTRSDIVTIPTGVTGIENPDIFTNLTIYPNPSKGLFIIEMDNNLYGDLLAGIISLDGKELRNFKFEKFSDYFSSQIDLTGLPRGNYLIKIDIDKKFAIRKIIIE
ncbi:MAG: FG-GAP-like repeat-containing protein [Bacteroidia bacterium]|nr:FG-GAP-like repeat-containing protein [Bacteroidia bacterium]